MTARYRYRYRLRVSRWHGWRWKVEVLTPAIAGERCVGVSARHWTRWAALRAGREIARRKGLT